MKKIRLDPGDLRVESFVTGDAVGSEPGTVFQMANTYCDHTCDGAMNTCHGAGECDSDMCDWTNLGAMSCTGGGGPSFPTALGHGCTPTESEVGCTFYDDCDGLTEDTEECGEIPESGGF
jgi:hypothetical protein